MKSIITQSIFQLILAFQLVRVTVQIHIPNVAATGNGKRSQPRFLIGNRDQDSFKRSMGRQIRIPLVAAHGYGKRSGPSSSRLDSETLVRQWLYDTLEDKHKVSRANAHNNAKGFKPWGLPNDQTNGESYVHLSPLLENEDRIDARDRDNYGVPQLFGEVDNIDDGENVNDVEDVPRLEDPSRYSDRDSQFRSSSLLNSARKGNQRERLIDILEHKLADAVLDKEGFNME